MVMNLVRPKAAAWREILINRPASGAYLTCKHITMDKMPASAIRD